MLVGDSVFAPAPYGVRRDRLARLLRRVADRLGRSCGEDVIDLFELLAHERHHTEDFSHTQDGSSVEKS